MWGRGCGGGSQRQPPTLEAPSNYDGGLPVGGGERVEGLCGERAEPAPSPQTCQRAPSPPAGTEEPLESLPGARGLVAGAPGARQTPGRLQLGAVWGRPPGSCTCGGASAAGGLGRGAACGLRQPRPGPGDPEAGQGPQPICAPVLPAAEPSATQVLPSRANWSTWRLGDAGSLGTPEGPASLAVPDTFSPTATQPATNTHEPLPGGRNPPSSS